MNIILYLLQIIQYLYQQNCWLINLSADISLSNSGLSMIPILQNIKNLRLINFLSSKPLWNRTGSSSSNTISGSTESLSNRSGAAMANPFRKIPSARYAVLHITSFTTITAVTASSSAKSVARPFRPVKSLRHPSVLSVLTVAIPLLQRKTAGFPHT